MLYQAIVSKQMNRIHMRNDNRFLDFFEDPEVLESAVVRLADGWDNVEGLMTSTGKGEKYSII